MDKASRIGADLVLDDLAQPGRSWAKVRLPAFFTESVSLLLYLVSLALARYLHTAFPNKLDDRGQFVGIEPDAVLLADIDDHARSFCKIVAVHQLTAIRTWNVIYLRELLRFLSAIGKKSKYCRLAFAVEANRFKGICRHPKPVAFGTTGQCRLFDHERFHFGLTSRAIARCFLWIERDGFRHSPAALAEFASEKHQIEARRTADGLEPRLTKLTL